MFSSSITPKHAAASFRIATFVLTCFCGLSCFLSGSVALAQPATGAMQDGADVLLNDRMPRDTRDLKVTQNVGDSVSKNLPLIDSLGRKVRFGDYLGDGKPLILTLNYSNCPMLCNVQLNQLAQSLEKADLKIGEDFRLLSVSIDPSETDQRLRDTKVKYVEQVPSHPQADDGWAFTRTNKRVIDQLADEAGFAYKYNSNTKEYAHPAMLVFISPEGLITRYSLGIAFPPDQMKLALIEAGQGEVGSVIDQFVMWCYDFDPNANSYVPQAWKIMRLGGGLTIVLMGLALLPYWLGRKGRAGGNGENQNGNQLPPGSRGKDLDGDRSASETAPLKPTQWHMS